MKHGVSDVDIRTKKKSVISSGLWKITTGGNLFLRYRGFLLVLSATCIYRLFYNFRDISAILATLRMPLNMHVKQRPASYHMANIFHTQGRHLPGCWHQNFSTTLSFSSSLTKRRIFTLDESWYLAISTCRLPLWNFAHDLWRAYL